MISGSLSNNNVSMEFWASVVLGSSSRLQIALSKLCTKECLAIRIGSLTLHQNLCPWETEFSAAVAKLGANGSWN